MRQSTGAENKKLAEKIYSKVLVEIEEGRYFDKPKSIKMTEVIERFIKEVSPLQKGSHARNGQIAKHLKPFFGDTLLSDVTASNLSRYKAQRLQEVSPSTVRRELSLLRQVFNVAIDEWEICERNPVRKVIKGLKDEKRVRYLLPEETEKLRFTIPKWLMPIVITACQTGLRRTNIVDLLVSQVDFETGRIIIEKTKNGDPISVAMTSVVREALLEVLRSRKVTSPYVFCNDKGERYSPYQVSVAFKRACTRAGVTNLRLHDLRHDFATLMLRKTRNLVDVQHALGHKDPRMTMRYAHLVPDDLREAFSKIDGEGTASVLSQIYHSDKTKGAAKAATP